MTIQTYHIDVPTFDPLALYLGLCPEGPGLLETPCPSEKTGRYSIVPLRRRESWYLRRGQLVERSENGETILPGQPLDTLAAILEERRQPNQEGLPPFPGGFFGYFGYDLAWQIENLPVKAQREKGIPDLWLDWIDLSATYDHQTGRLTLCSLRGEDDLERIAEEARRILERPLPAPSRPSETTALPVMDRHRFETIVRRAKEYIAAGDIYQANLSCRFDAQWTGSSIDLFRQLRDINPSPFACYLRTPFAEIVSSSPERLVSLRGRLAETRPIAGTRPRGFAAEQNAALEQELLAHPKERAEHVMLLDLERNDLGRVCTGGSVEVDEFMALERYSHVVHIVSNVRGQLRDDAGPFDLLKATFPGGTITGCPKKRCMEIIEELEPVGRGTYTGSAGYISVTGDMDLNILIRTFQRVGDRLSYQVGAGIVADSDPQHEWQECLAKGEAMKKALEGKP
ncbi:MAG TPA: aminodeoxychorismate synthase, component I [Desulfuromonadales bacterium]|nr:aminodeoxychorismate synthase, component I [Desulfuromonadales bacterium]